VNAFTTAPAKPLSAMRTLLQLLNPFAPHLTEELSEKLSERFSSPNENIAVGTWPAFDEKFLIEDEVDIILQVNGKLRDRIKMPKDATDAELEAAALANVRVREFIEGRKVLKIVSVKNKLVNVVAPH